MAAVAILPLIDAPDLRAPAARAVCTDCGVSRTAFAEACEAACAFTTDRRAALEAAAHGRAADASRGAEAAFGAYRTLRRVVAAPPVHGPMAEGLLAQLASRLLAQREIDAVALAVAEAAGPARAEARLVTDAATMAGTLPALEATAPVIAMLEAAALAGYRRVAVIAVGCQAHAVRAVEAQLPFERLLVLGAGCEGREPGSGTAAQRAAAREACRRCTDDTTALADVSIVAGREASDAWVLARNARGRAALDAFGRDLALDAVPMDALAAWTSRRRARVAGVAS